MARRRKQSNQAGGAIAAVVLAVIALGVWIWRAGLDSVSQTTKDGLERLGIDTQAFKDVAKHAEEWWTIHDDGAITYKDGYEGRDTGVVSDFTGETWRVYGPTLDEQNIGASPLPNVDISSPFHADNNAGTNNFIVNKDGHLLRVTMVRHANGKDSYAIDTWTDSHPSRPAGKTYVHAPYITTATNKTGCGPGQDVYTPYDCKVKALVLDEARMLLDKGTLEPVIVP